MTSHIHFLTERESQSIYFIRCATEWNDGQQVAE